MINSNANRFSRKRLSTDTWPFIAGVVLLLLTGLGVSSALSPLLSVLFDPMAYYGDRAGESVNIAVDTLGEINSLRGTNRELLEENDRLEAENSLYQVVSDENDALRDQLDLGRKEVELIDARVVLYDPSGYITIAAGSRNGVKDGQVVVVGNTYIGRVSQVLTRSAKVQLPTSGDSVLQVYVGEGVNGLASVDDLNKDLPQITRAFVRGSASGSKRGIVVENITQKAAVGLGDYVLVNDIKVEDVLFLGTVSEIDDDPTLPEQVAVVEPFLNYEELSSVFVIK